MGNTIYEAQDLNLFKGQRAKHGKAILAKINVSLRFGYKDLKRKRIHSILPVLN